MGNPDQPTPKHILDKLVEASVRGTDSDYVKPELHDEEGVHTHRYSVSKGIPRLRRAMARWYKQRYDVDLDPESEVIAPIGSKEGPIGRASCREKGVSAFRTRWSREH